MTPVVVYPTIQCLGIIESFNLINTFVISKPRMENGNSDINKLHTRLLLAIYLYLPRLSLDYLFFHFQNKDKNKKQNNISSLTAIDIYIETFSIVEVSKVCGLAKSFLQGIERCSLKIG